MSYRGWCGSEKRIGAGNVGGRGIDGVSRGSNYLESHKGGQLQKGKLWIKEVQLPSTSAPYAVTHRRFAASKSMPASKLAFIWVTGWNSESRPALAARWRGFDLNMGTENKDKYSGAKHEVVPTT